MQEDNQEQNETKRSREENNNEGNKKETRTSSTIGDKNQEHKALSYDAHEISVKEIGRFLEANQESHIKSHENFHLFYRIRP